MPPPDSGSGSISDVQERLERLVLAPGDERYDFKVVLKILELFVPWGFGVFGEEERCSQRANVNVGRPAGILGQSLQYKYYLRWEPAVASRAEDRFLQTFRFA